MLKEKCSDEKTKIKFYFKNNLLDLSFRFTVRDKQLSSKNFEIYNH